MYVWTISFVKPGAFRQLRQQATLEQEVWLPSIGRFCQSARHLSCKVKSCRMLSTAKQLLIGIMQHEAEELNRTRSEAVPDGNIWSHGSHVHVRESFWTHLGNVRDNSYGKLITHTSIQQARKICIRNLSSKPHWNWLWKQSNWQSHLQKQRGNW